MRYNANVFRAMIEMTTLLTAPQEVLARPGLAECIEEVTPDTTPWRRPALHAMTCYGGWH
jgi:hypothetical protein